MKSASDYLRNHKSIQVIIVMVLSLLAGVFCDYLSYLNLGPTSVGTWYNKYWIVFFAAVSFCIGLLVIYRKELEDKPEKYFLGILLVITLSSSFVFDVNRCSWDADSHFYMTLSWSEPDLDAQLTEAEYDASYNWANHIETDIADLAGWKNLLNEADYSSTEQHAQASLTQIYNRLTVLPSGILYALLSLIGISFSTKYMLARCLYPIIYSFVCYFGMKRLRSGKMIFAAIAMLPTALFIVSNYGYDYWVTCFMLYGVACLAGEMQRPDQPLTLKRIILMLGALFLACGPKAIYFPIILLCLMMPRSKFSSAAKSRIYRGAVIVVAILVVCSFFLSFLVSVSSGTAGGDTRTNSTASTSGQVAYILSNPIGYLGILFNFLLNYLSIDGSQGWTVFYAYLGSADKLLWAINIALIGFVALTDKDSSDSVLSTWKTRTWSILVYVGTAGLVATSLYVSYTAVGASTVDGCQPRYLIPLLFGLLIFLGSPKLGTAIKSRFSYYNTTCMIIFTALPLICTWQTYISLLY